MDARYSSNALSFVINNFNLMSTCLLRLIGCAVHPIVVPSEQDSICSSGRHQKPFLYCASRFERICFPSSVLFSVRAHAPAIFTLLFIHKFILAVLFNNRKKELVSVKHWRKIANWVVSVLRLIPCYVENKVFAFPPQLDGFNGAGYESSK